MTTQSLRRTPLYQVQKELGARFVDFHGWELPVQFTSILKEHQAVRSACGLFDVSHMGQIFVEGADAEAFLQRVQSNDISKLKPGRALYAHMLNEKGGVVDDVIVSRLGDMRWLIVVNGATREKDAAWLKSQSQDFKVKLDDQSDDLAMIAVQGPKAADIVAGLAPEAALLKRFGALEQDLYGQRAVITRTGYTGEDGFEFIARDEILIRVWGNLLASGRSLGVTACGLGARDTLRLEAGYLLYGSDIDDDHTPLEAGYDWVVKFDKKDFIGKAALEKQKASGLKRRMRGLKLSERGVPRPHAPVLLGGTKIGELSSATFSPTLSAGIGMGYFPTDLGVGDLAVELHGKAVAAQFCELPFYRR